MPSVSVIIPNYNHAKYLVQRTDSVLNQTFEDFEVIILDDCSSDSSKEIIEKYRIHPKVSNIIYNDKNSGSTFKQWEKGIALAKGEYIWIAESDDTSSPYFLEKLLIVLENNPKITLAFSSSYNIDESGQILNINSWAEGLDKNRWKKNYFNNGIEEIQSYFVYRNLIPNASAVVFRKKYFLCIDKTLYTNLRYAGDWLIWSSIVYYGDIAYISDSLNYFRMHASTTRSGKSINQELNRLKEYFYVINYIKNKLRLKTVKIEKHNWIINEWVYNNNHFSALYFKKYYFPPPIKGKYLVLLYKEFIKNSIKNSIIENCIRFL